MKKGWKIGLTVIAVAAALYLMPFITVKDGDYQVPFLSSFASKTDTELEFTSVRSAYALGKDASNAIHSYTEKKCYGSTYYYDSSNDITYSGYRTEAGFPVNHLYYEYASGNTCEGWTNDDEVAWPYGSLEDVDGQITVQQAEDNEWYVVVDGVPQNSGVYNSFARLVKQTQLCYMRAVIYNGNSVSFTDIQYLSDTSIRVTQRTGDSIAETSYSYLSEAEINGQLYYCAYYGSGSDETPVPLFPVQ